MRCPYLQHADVTYCRNSVVCKMIVRAPDNREEERCSSPAHRDCSLFREHPGESAPGPGCPFLKEASVEYCGMAPVRKYVPHSDSRFSRCEGGRYHYCDVYRRASAAAGASRERPAEHWVHGLRTPAWLFYSANHMWLDRVEDGSCHVGVDAFLVSLLGPVEQVTFVTHQGVGRPAAVLTARGMDVQMVFPNLMAVTGPNHAVRGNPAHLAADPYGLGWLFEGVGADFDGLLPGAEAGAWISREVSHLAEFLRGPAGGCPSLADGGELDPRLLQSLDREERFQLVNEFFSPYAGWKRPS